VALAESALQSSKRLHGSRRIWDDGGTNMLGSYTLNIFKHLLQYP
jgi:hypothetical protein